MGQSHGRRRGHVCIEDRRHWYDVTKLKDVMITSVGGVSTMDLGRISSFSAFFCGIGTVLYGSRVKFGSRGL
jgi:hypothetical protein